jgi:hypothetical protein
VWGVPLQFLFRLIWVPVSPNMTASVAQSVQRQVGQPGFDLYSTEPRPVPGLTQLPTQWVPVALSPGVKRPGLEAD